MINDVEGGLWVKREKKQTTMWKNKGGREGGWREMQRSVCDGVNDEKLCRPRLVRSPGYETARRIDRQTDEKNEWPFLLERRRARRSVITSLSLSLSLSLTHSPLSFLTHVLHGLGEKNGSPRYRREKE